MTRAFWMFWSSEAVSALGGQLAMVAFPWLILQLTHDAVFMASAFAVMTVPFAIMSLVGGVLADRYSPKVLLVFTQGAGLIAVSVLVASVLGGAISLRIVYIVGFALASFEAIASPARFALLPQLLPPARLNRATAIVYGTYQLSQAAGRGIAGTLIVMSSARFEGTGGSVGVAQVTACGIAFSVTAVAYVVALLFLAGVRTMKRVATPRPAANESMPRSIAEGFATIWRGRGLRLILLVTVVTTMLVECIRHGSTRLGAARALSARERREGVAPAGTETVA